MVYSIKVRCLISYKQLMEAREAFLKDPKPDMVIEENTSTTLFSDYCMLWIPEQRLAKQLLQLLPGVQVWPETRIQTSFGSSIVCYLLLYNQDIIALKNELTTISATINASFSFYE